MFKRTNTRVEKEPHGIVLTVQTQTTTDMVFHGCQLIGILR